MPRACTFLGAASSERSRILVAEIERGLDPRDVVEALESALPADWELVNSSSRSLKP